MDKPVTTKNNMTIKRGIELLEELESANKWIEILGKINRQLIEYVMENICKKKQ